MNIRSLLAMADTVIRHSRSTTPVLVRWVERSGGTVNPVNGRYEGGTITHEEETIEAMVHFSEAKAVSRTLAEIEVGDMIMDHPATISLRDRLDVVAVVGGREYVPKEVGKKAADVADALTGGQTEWVTTLWRRRA
ncbi:MAG: hypothetical protein ACYDC1_06335 [Limisphaerales bacterium]